MTIYALFPLVAAIAYIFLLITTLSSRPWQRQHKLFILFLIPAIFWSLADFFLRGHFLRQYSFLQGQLIMVMFMWMLIQFHCFTSSYFPQGKGRWLPFAYTSLAAVIVVVALGYLPQEIVVVEEKVYPGYGIWVLFVAVPLIILLIRNVRVLWQRLKIVDNPVLSNQITSLLLALFVMTFFSLAALIPWGKEYPIVHFGGIINAVILTYATIRHQLVDIKTVLQRGLETIGLLVIGATLYSLLLIVFHAILSFQLDLLTMSVTGLVGAIVAVLVYKLRNVFAITLGKAFQGQRFDYRQKLSDFASKIHNVFSLREQGGELLELVTKAIGCTKAYLLFPETGSKDFVTKFVEPRGEDNPLLSFRLKGHNPILEYLAQEQKPLTRESLAVLPEFKSLWEQEREEIKVNEIELFMPLISRGRLIAVLALAKKVSGRYSLEDFNLLADVTNRVAVSMEKEYLQEQLKEREKELSVINRSSAILTSSLDIRQIYDSFIQELKRVVDVSWAAITLIEGDALHFLALFSGAGSAWRVGERIPIKGTATEWMAAHKKSVFEPDLLEKSRFSIGKYYIEHGIRSIAYLPLIVKGESIGSLIVASTRPNAYSPRQVLLLEQLASQIAMPVENSRLYAEVERQARIDALTGLLNRRSLDEMISSEIDRYSRYGGSFSLIIFDLDSFKVFNDNYGHLAGDKLLAQVGSITKGAIRNVDQAFRYGGDEFAILLPQTGVEVATEVAERVRKLIVAKVKSDSAPITVSLGLAGWPADGIRPMEILAAADMALYHAKRNGGDQICCASSILPSSSARGLDFGSDGDGETLSMVYTLAAAVDARDHYTGNHSKKVQKYTLALAKALKLEAGEVTKLSNCALLHDIGKVGIGNEILNKPDKVDEKEMEILKTHSRVGATILARAPQFACCAPIILYHHERYDGSGYPEGLKGEEIPLGARILAIADAFAAMTSERPYSKALPIEEALEELKRGAGTQFDPKLVDVFLSIMKTTQTMVE